MDCIAGELRDVVHDLPGLCASADDLVRASSFDHGIQFESHGDVVRGHLAMDDCSAVRSP